MKPLKMFGLAVLGALTAMAFTGASSAMAESTALCNEDSTTCAGGHLVTHVHEVTLTGKKAKLLNSLMTVECDVSFLGDTVKELGAPLVIEGNFTYTNCGSCEVEEIGGPSIVNVLRTGHETASVTGEGEVHVKCSAINCYYNGEELLGTAKGPLLSTETSGEVSIAGQATNKVKGTFCPSTAFLDIVIASAPTCTTLPVYIAK